jgi:hypothetical protein
MSLHDCTLSSATLNWRLGELQIGLLAHEGPRSIIAHGLRDLRVPRAFPWGPSVSVNSVDGPRPNPDGGQRLDIEMQSGDRIVIVADEIIMPA